MAKQRYENRKQVKNARWLIFFVVLAQLAADVAVQAIVSFMPEPPHQYIQIALCEILAVGVPIFVYGRSVRRGSSGALKKELMLKPCAVRLVVTAALLGITGQFIMMLLNMPANIYIREVLKTESADAIPVALSGWELLLGSAAVVVIPAVLEEFWMRGLVFSAYNRCSTSAAIVFTSVVFALIHMRADEFAGFLFMGFTAAYIMLRTRSLYAAIAYHAASNLAALCFGYVLAGILPYIWYIFGAAVVLFTVFAVLLLRGTERIRRNRTMRAGKLFWKSVFSLPFLLSVALAVLRHFITL